MASRFASKPSWTPPGYRLYVVLRTTPHLQAALTERDRRAPLEFRPDILFRRLNVPGNLLDDIQRATVPSREWALEIVGDHHELPPFDEEVISLEFRTAAFQLEFRRLMFEQVGRPVDEVDIIVLAVGADIGGRQADQWCPGTKGPATFGSRTDALRSIRADALQQDGLTGRRVNVVIIDQGLDRTLIPARNWGGGIAWMGRQPGTADRTSHGMLMARNVLSLAPDAILYDVPLIPPRITDVPTFASDADTLYRVLLWAITFLRLLPRWSGPWVYANAWAIFDRASEVPLGDYTENLHPLGHPLNNLVGATVDQGGIDIAFAAGNCGQFCFSKRCGPVDRGPGHDIWGANAHPAVVTTGAVRADGGWIGYSSQGPGPARLEPRKPDLCLPSNFVDPFDAHVQETGTSTACALLVGILAALRSNPKWTTLHVKSGLLKQELVGTAEKVGGPGWDRRFGFGVLDIRATIAALKALP